MTLGTVLLVAAVALAAVAAAAWAVTAWAATPRTAGRVAGDGGLPATARRAAPLATYGAALAVAGAVALLEVALVRQDTDVAYVARVASADMGVYYRVTALWSALEGSLLLWLAALAAVTAGAAATLRRLDGPTRATSLAVLAGLVTVFGVVSLLASPFVASVVRGAPPSPLLRDHVAMGMHPPLLYAGFALLAVPYALSVAACVDRRVSSGAVATARAWNLAAWTALTAGIGLGAWWSYAVLGWGGYWAWDPVENASLLPWLTATALLHTLGPRTRRGRWRTWAVVLGGLGFVLVVLAQVITRSGVVESVHAFTASTLGPVLVAALGLVLVPWLLLLRRWSRTRAADRPGERRRPGVHTAALEAQRVLLVAVLVVVAVGTLLPTALLVTTGERVSVGAPWYARTLAPPALALLVLLAATPWLRDRPGRRGAPPGLLAAAGAAAVTSCAVGLLARDAALALTGALAAFVVVTGVAQVARDRRALGAWLAHTGVAVVAVAVVAGGQSLVREESVPVGGSVTAGTTSVTLVQLDRRAELGHHVAEAELVVGEGGRYVGTLRPQLRWYDADGVLVAGPATRSTLTGDVHVAILDADPGAGTVTLRLAVTPLVGWIWAGGLLLVAGAALAGARGARRRRNDARPRGTTRPTTRAGGDRLLRSRLVHGLVALPALALATAGCAARTEAPEPAPPLAGPDLDGVARDLADLEGSVVLVPAWASWCGPCVDEMPLIADAAARHEDDGLVVLGLNVRDLPGNARAFAERHDVPFPSVSDLDGTTAVGWGLRGLPMTYLVDREGRLVETRVGPVDEAWLEDVVAEEVRR
ncbi:cytochrome c-type biogenesis CcmF C-terminal domain-containing protein [Cellulosimicrobium sp. NPDC057127]|uniref:cytochrome c-type biogenesis CcmF C-terminal domain-containing protein n=1 Tax=Cellulosimicrobium sp. NPDC057127 TaxID=3346026 RepID=UPI00364005C5